MTPAHRHYLMVEMGIGAIINAVMSVAFVWLVFGRSSYVSIPALTLDALPQSFMVALMGSIVPTLLTRRRLGAGVIALLSPIRLAIPRPVVWRGLALALLVAVAAVAAHWLLLPLFTPASWPFAAVLAYKTVYGAALGAGVSLLAVRVALSDGPLLSATDLPSGTHPLS